MNIYKSIVERNLREHIEVIQSSIQKQLDTFETIADVMVEVFRNGNKIMICGNGGSAADAQHLAAEFVSSFQHGLSRKALPAIALTTDSSILTAFSNDFDFEGIFARQIEGLGRHGDLLVVLSTSGTSRNCIRATEVSQSMNIKTLALTQEYSELSGLSDFALVVGSEDTQRIQEAHIFMYHTLCELVERKLMLDKDRITP